MIKIHDILFTTDQEKLEGQIDGFDRKSLSTEKRYFLYFH